LFTKCVQLSYAQPKHSVHSFRVHQTRQEVNSKEYTMKSFTVGLLQAFEESTDSALIFCDDSNLHLSVFKYVLSTLGISKEFIGKS